MPLLADVRHAIRLLLRQRASALLIIVTLALGIGATSAMFSVINGVLLRPLPYSQPDRLVRLFWPEDNERASAATSPADFLDFKRENRSLISLAGWVEQVNDISAGSGFPERAKGAQVTDEFFDVFGVAPLRGRTFTSQADTPKPAQTERGTVAVLSYGMWQRRFGGREDAIGKSLLVNGHPKTIIGVMPPAFAWPDEETALWTLGPQAVPDCPIAYEGDLLTQRDLEYFNTAGRLRPDVTLAAAQSNADAVAAQLRARHVESNRNRRISLIPLKESIVGESRTALLVLLGAVGLVLLIACANVANLLLARASDRHREMAVRTALGAPRSRLIRQLLVESSVLAIVGGVFGLLVAQWGATGLLALAPKDLPRLAEVHVDWTVVMFTTALCLLTGLLFGLAPALQSSRVMPQDALRDSGTRTTGGGRGAQATRSALVVAQVALALILVTSAALMVTSFSRLQSVDPGFKTAQLVSASLPLPPARYPTSARQHQFYQQVLERLQATPLGASSTLVFPLPLRAAQADASFAIDGRTPAPGTPEPTAAISSIAPGYFRTLSIPMVRGRDIAPHDTKDAPPVAVVNAAFAEKYWPGEDAIGKRLLFGEKESDKVTVVGVVGNIKGYGLDRPAPPTLYFPFQQFTVPYSALILRTTAQPGDVATALRGIVRQIDPELPIDRVQAIDEMIGDAVAQPKFRTMLLAVFAGTALLLALVGVYGVISYAVSLRRRELGVRAALGATPVELLRLVMKQGLSLAAIGVAAGLVGAFAIGGLLKGLLYGVAATDPLTLAVSTLALLIVAALAAAIPARRAMRQDPLAALRDK